MFKGTDRDAYKRAGKGRTAESRSRLYQKYKKQNNRRRVISDIKQSLLGGKSYSNTVPKTRQPIKRGVQSPKVKYYAKNTILDDIREYRSSKIVSNISNSIATFIVRKGGARWDNNTKDIVRSTIALAISEVTKKVLEKPLEVVDNIELFIKVSQIIYKVIVWLNKNTGLWETNNHSVSVVKDTDKKYLEYAKKYPKLVREERETCNKSDDLHLDRPMTTLFMLMSVDGKISTGSTDEMDFDMDLPTIDGVKEGLNQYYDIEKTTDLWAFNTGKVLAKIGANDKPTTTKTPVSFVVLDNQHLTKDGIQYLCARSKTFVLITENREHPAFGMEADNLHIIYQEALNLRQVLSTLKGQFGCERLTIQSGGTVNALFLREKLLDYVDIVVAPVLIGGSETPTLIDGTSLAVKNELPKVGVLQLSECIRLDNSYLRLKYKICKE